jgi:hypothetical protein
VGKEKKEIMADEQVKFRSGESGLMAEVVAALRQGLGDNLLSVVLFGSRARGEVKEESDWDLLVIARDLPARTLERHILLKSMVPVAWRGQMAILSKTSQEFEARLQSLFLDIALDGIILYDTDEYMAERLARVRRLMQQRGLRRETVEGDLVWRWEHFPGFDWSLEWETTP